jgi:hypothetical protein
MDDVERWYWIVNPDRTDEEVLLSTHQRWTTKEIKGHVLVIKGDKNNISRFTLLEWRSSIDNMQSYRKS